MKIKSPIVGVFMLILLGAGCFLYSSYKNKQLAHSTSRWVSHTHEVIGKINRLRATLFEMEASTQGFIISGNNKFAIHFEERAKDLKDHLSDLKQLTVDNLVQQQNIATVERLILQKIKVHHKVSTAYKKNAAEALMLAKLEWEKDLSDSIKTMLEAMSREESNLLVIRTAANNAIIQKRFSSSVAVALVALALFTIGLFFIYKENLLRKNAEAEIKASEAKYKSLVENASVAVCTINLNGVFDFISPKCYQITGFTPEELTGKYFTHIVADEWKERVANFYLAQYREASVETTLSFPIRTKNGEEKWIEQSVLLLQENGVPTGFQSIVKDITEKKNAEALVKKAERKIKQKQEEYQFRLQAILDHIPMIVYLKDLEGRFLMVNKHFKETLGVNDEQVLGKTVYEVNEQAIASRHVEADETVIRTLQPLEIEEVVVTKEGQRNMLVTKFPLFDNKKKLFAICGVDKDITDMVHYRDELVTARERAEAAEKLQEEFLANMSHEIRTPMNGIIGMTHVLLDSELTAAQQEYVHIIKSSSDSLLVLINDILDLSKIKAGRMSLEELDFSIADVIEQVMAPMQVRTAAKGVKLHKIIDADLPAFVWGDQHKLIQILNNLLSNAVKFTHEGSIDLEIKVLAQTDYVIDVQFLVRDTGIGIASHKIEDVFESFVQAGNDMVRRFGGTGLGLAITKRLVHLQGGNITVQSTEGEGTIFTFEICYARSEKTLDDNGRSNVGIAFKEASCIAGRRILVVEDNEVNQKVICTILSKAKLVIDVANNGKEAISILQSGRSYDLIIMDLQMPEMDGFQTTAFIRNKLGIAVPIIAMTASALRNEKQKCFDLGMNEYLTKPFAPKEIFSHLSRLLNAEDTTQIEVAVSSKPANEIYNLEYLHEMDDADYIKEVLQMFLDTTPQLLESMRSGAIREDWETVHKTAHKLKSSLGILQANKMLENTTQIEMFAKEKKQTDKVPGLIQSVQDQFNLLQPMLLAEMAEAA